MAIRSYKNNINSLEFRGQRVSTEDLSFFGAGLENVEFSAEGKNVVVTKIYDGSNNLLNVKFEKASPPTDPATGEFYIRPDLEVKELGYQTGTFRVEYNFWKFMVGDDQKPGVFVKEISTSRSEVRIAPLIPPTPDDIQTFAPEGLEIKKDFFDFANVVMNPAEFNVLLDDIFNDIDVAVTINKLDIAFLDRLYSEFGLTDISFADTLSNIFKTSRENMLLGLLERGFVGYNEFIRLFDTTMKEAIMLYFGDTPQLVAPPNNNVNISVEERIVLPGLVSPIEAPIPEYNNISTKERKKEEKAKRDKERLEKKNRRKQR